MREREMVGETGVKTMVLKNVLSRSFGLGYVDPSHNIILAMLYIRLWAF